MPAEPRNELRSLRRYPIPRRRSDYLWLDRNEAPFPPPGNVVAAAARAAGWANRYPSGEELEELTRMIAAYAGVDEANVLPTAGSDEALRLLFDVYTREGSCRVALTKPGFAMNYHFARLRACEVIELQLREEGDQWVLPVEKLIEAAEAGPLDAIFIENPHNPTGSLLLSPSEVAYLAERLPDTLIVVDEAYYEFAGVTAVELAVTERNVVVTRTLSKAFALAGFRVGYLITHPEQIEVLAAAQPPFTIPSPSIAAAVEALRDPWYAKEIVRYVIEERERVRSELLQLNFYTVYRSHTNFILVRAPEGINLVEELEARGIYVRRMGGLPENYARITIGRREENDRVIEALKEVAESASRAGRSPQA